MSGFQPQLHHNQELIRSADSNYPYPSPEWLFTNETWTNEQLSLYYHNRTGKSL